MPTIDIDPVKYGAMWQQVQDMSTKLDKMEKQMDMLLEMANRSRGGLWIGMTIVATLTALLTAGVSLIRHFK